MSLADAFAPIEARYRAQVIRETFGHLAPKPREKYPIVILFTHGEYRDITVIRTEGGPDSSPWFYEDLHEFCGKGKIGRTTIEDRCVYRFTGTYKKFKNGNYRFSGKVKKVL